MPLRTKTVFVIGAGCSKEFNLPVGYELLNNIYNKLHDHTFREQDSLPNAILSSGVTANLEEKINRFAAGLHSRPSIDQYLDFHKDDPELVKIGKVAIVFEILEAEAKSSLAFDGRYLQKSRISDTWLMKLYHVISASVNKGDLADIFKNVTFICFNYDRCLEHALFNIIRDQAHLSDSEAATILMSLNIIHPYGTIGLLPWQRTDENQPFIAFGRPNNLAYDPARSWQRIRTFTESVDTIVNQAVSNAIEEAERLVVMGFSYLEQNIQILSPNKMPAHQSVLLDLYGIEDIDVQFHINRLKAKFYDHGDFHRDAPDELVHDSLLASRFVEKYSRYLAA